jgi:hypothetical protein
MNENIPSNENAEKILNEREVINAIEEIIGDREYEVVNSVEDEKGLWKFSLKFKGEDGEFVQYDYRRDDNAGETVIDVIYYDGDMPVGGEPVKKYKDGEWVPE